MCCTCIMCILLVKSQGDITGYIITRKIYYKVVNLLTIQYYVSLKLDHRLRRASKQRQDIDAGPALTKHCVNVSCLSEYL